MTKQREMRLAELAERSGVPGRTVRLYISQGLLPGPLRAGRNAAYGQEHLDVLRRIRALQREGLTLTQVRHVLAADGGGAAVPEPVSWRQYTLAPDLQVWVRQEITPWRAKVIRDGLAQLSERLADGTDKEGGHGVD